MLLIATAHLLPRSSCKPTPSPCPDELSYGTIVYSGLGCDWFDGLLKCLLDYSFVLAWWEDNGRHCQWNFEDAHDRSCATPIQLVWQEGQKVCTVCLKVLAKHACVYHTLRCPSCVILLLTTLWGLPSVQMLCQLKLSSWLPYSSTPQAVSNGWWDAAVVLSQSSISHCIKDVMNALVKLAPTFISFPTDPTTLWANKQAFHAVAHFPNVNGGKTACTLLSKRRQWMRKHTLTARVYTRSMSRVCVMLTWNCWMSLLSALVARRTASSGGLVVCMICLNVDICKEHGCLVR